MTLEGKKLQAKPFLKWVGGKSKLVPLLKERFPSEYNDYYEPFLGGGALFFTMNDKRAHVNDMNEVLIQAYINIQMNVELLVKKLNSIQSEYMSLTGLEAKKVYFLEKRTEYNSLKNNDFSKTAYLIFLNKTCFNGMYRENSKGGYNVPFGKQEKPNICDESNLQSVSKALQHTTISNGSYLSAIKNAKMGDFIYLDPPYHPINSTSSFTAYQAGGFTAEDQEKLRDTFVDLSERGCKVMVSNSNASLIKELYKKYNTYEIQAARSINSAASGRGKITELIITSY